MATVLTCRSPRSEHTRHPGMGVAVESKSVPKESTFEHICKHFGDTVVKVIDLTTRAQLFVHLQTRIGDRIWAEKPDGRVYWIEKSAVDCGTIVIELASKTACQHLKFAAESYYPDRSGDYYRVIYQRD